MTGEAGKEGRHLFWRGLGRETSGVEPHMERHLGCQGPGEAHLLTVMTSSCE